MKKTCITLMLLAIILLTACVGTSDSAKYLRIHIRANSNSQVDQSVKFQVKEEVVNYLTPLLLGINDKALVISVIQQEKANIENMVNKTLVNNGFYYGCSLVVGNFEFPTRVYGDLTLEEGFYDAVIVNLGEGKGDNWWCVVYPPLCFAGGSEIDGYKSFIYEFFKKIKAT